MKRNFDTERLALGSLTLKDASFIKALVNSPGWLKYIGDRNIQTMADAKKYVKKINADPNVHYWVVKTKHDNIPVGIVCAIQRNHLEFPDLGFAFLPDYKKLGYAFESSLIVLNYLKRIHAPNPVLAFTKTVNIDSIRLLEKLGFRFQKEIDVDGHPHILYSTESGS